MLLPMLLSHLYYNHMSADTYDGSFPWEHPIETRLQADGYVNGTIFVLTDLWNRASLS